MNRRTCLILGLAMGVFLGCSQGTETLNQSEAAPSNHDIRNGIEISESYQPAVGALWQRSATDPNVYRQFCSGTLIRPGIVLTAAHCVVNTSTGERRDPRTLFFSTTTEGVSTGVNGTFRIPPERMLAVLTTRVKSDYNFRQVVNPGDLAILYLTSNGPRLTSYPSVLRGTAVPSLGQYLQIVGFGTDENFSHGIKRVGYVRYAQSEPAFVRQTPGADDQIICPGDSGGPLFFYHQGRYYLYGVASFVGLRGGLDNTCRRVVNGAHVATRPNDLWITYSSISLITKPWLNPSFSRDVNNDGRVSNADALEVIGQISRRGGPGRLLYGTDTLPAQGGAFWDVNGDGSITALDALLVINHVNSTGGAGPIPPVSD